MGKRVPKKEKRDFAAKVKAWREREGLSQSQAAAKLGILLDTLQNWEIARTKFTGFGCAALLKVITSR